MNRPRTVAVLGAGSWGTALAIVLARYGIEMPIAGQVQQVLYEGLAPRVGVQSLLSRALTREDI